MKRIDLTMLKEDKTYLYKQIPREDHCETMISEDCQFYLHDELKGIYLQHWEPAEKLRKNILEIKRWDGGGRLTGVVSQSRTFGFSPRKPLLMRHEACSQAKMFKDHPDTLHALYEIAPEVEEVLRNYAPERAEKQLKEVSSRVLKEYIIPRSSFTSGIVNKNNPLQYHYDAGNFEGFFSAMIAFKKNTSGGHLNLPEYNVKLAIGDCSLALFDGQCELHGVTPIVKDSQGYRYTIVFYTLEALWRCLPYTEELRRAQIQRTKSEMRRAGLIK